ncbi:MAG: four helix bundle protein [Bacteroidales bacterium]|nr:four helix bundle protein [Bacteroidales bacterium]MBR3413427.1 four helix bundle protein [Bacteroidales bacterium]
MENTQEKVVSFFRFEDLRIYAKATDYSAWVISNLGTPTNDRQQNLANAFCHSSYDIALNIAEGSSRNKPQFEHYLKISKTAIRECIVYTTVAHTLGMLDDEHCEQSREYLMELTRMIGALIISLQRSSGRRRDETDADANSGSDEADDALDAIDTNF